MTEYSKEVSSSLDTLFNIMKDTFSPDPAKAVDQIMDGVRDKSLALAVTTLRDALEGGNQPISRSILTLQRHDCCEAEKLVKSLTLVLECLEMASRTEAVFVKPAFYENMCGTAQHCPKR